MRRETRLGMKAGLTVRVDGNAIAIVTELRFAVESHENGHFYSRSDQYWMMRDAGMVQLPTYGAVSISSQQLVFCLCARCAPRHGHATRQGRIHTPCQCPAFGPVRGRLSSHRQRSPSRDVGGRAGRGHHLVQSCRPLFAATLNRIQEWNDGRDTLRFDAGDSEATRIKLGPSSSEVEKLAFSHD